MGKISPVSAKYIIHTQIQIDGIVDKPDVVGSIFGQTEGLLGEDLELRELQRSGRIGRIEVELETKSGKTTGVLVIPSSMDKAETVLIAAALETIERIGPCNSKVSVTKVEDVRISKRTQLVNRAKDLLKNLTQEVLPDSTEIKDEVIESVRMMESVEYGKERLPAGPAVDASDDVIIVEGRADVLNLLRNDFKNCIALNGMNVIPQTVIDLCKKKTITVFVDGDRGGDLIIRNLSAVAEIDFVCKAPPGKEVEELAKKEIHKALRSRVAFEQVKMDTDYRGEVTMDIQQRMDKNGSDAPRTHESRPLSQESRAEQQTEQRSDRPREYTPRSDYTPRPYGARREYTPRRDSRSDSRGGFRDRGSRPSFRPFSSRPAAPQKLSEADTKTYRKMLDDLIGTHGAYILDEKLNILGRVPTSELDSTIKSLESVHAIVFDGQVTKEMVDLAERARVKYLVGMESTVTGPSSVSVLTSKDL